ncbi:MAG: hypothetical protein QXL27_08560 [Candidatus Bathyarchaeia archaeon]
MTQEIKVFPELCSSEPKSIVPSWDQVTFMPGDYTFYKEALYITVKTWVLRKYL